MWLKIEMRSSCATGRYRSLNLLGIRSAPELGYHLFVGDTSLTLCRLCLCNSKFLKEISLSLEALIVIYAHHCQIPFTVRSKVHRFILFMTDLGDLACSVSQLDMDFIIGIFYLALFMRKLNQNCDIIKYRYAAHFA